MSFYADRIFPYVLDWATKPLAQQRQKMIGLARGKVLEIGVGTGANLPFYSAEVKEVIAIEPGQPMLDKAHAFLANSDVKIKVNLQLGDAHKLNFANESFDTVVVCLVLCTIPDAERALKEVRRVVKTGGKVIFLEHVRADSAQLAKLQDWVTPAWKHLACGCHLNRDTEALFERCGFQFEQIARYRHPDMPALAGAIIEGVAIKPATVA